MENDRATLVRDLKQLMVTELKLQKAPADIKDDAPLFGPDGLGIDSLDSLQLGSSAELKYGIKIPIETDEGKAALGSVNALADYIMRTQSAAK
ncbi:MAG: phosphopantetheine-binding protein [Byssovorax sp.]